MTAMTDRPSVADPAGIPDSSELIARVKELQPLIRENAARGEQDRRVAEESIQAPRGLALP